MQLSKYRIESCIILQRLLPGSVKLCYKLSVCWLKELSVKKGVLQGSKWVDFFSFP